MFDLKGFYSNPWKKKARLKLKIFRFAEAEADSEILCHARGVRWPGRPGVTVLSTLATEGYYYKRFLVCFPLWSCDCHWSDWTRHGIRTVSCWAVPRNAREGDSTRTKRNADDGPCPHAKLGRPSFSKVCAGRQEVAELKEQAQALTTKISTTRPGPLDWEAKTDRQRDAMLFPTFEPRL